MRSAALAYFGCRLLRSESSLSGVLYGFGVSRSLLGLQHVLQVQVQYESGRNGLENITHKGELLEEFVSLGDVCLALLFVVAEFRRHCDFWSSRAVQD